MGHVAGFKENWIVRQPAPIELAGDEIVEFLDEHEVGVSWTPRSALTPRVVTLTSDNFQTTKGETLEEAVCLAFVKVEEENS